MKIVIIGNGIGGITAAREIRKRSAHHDITVISDESPYFFSRTALMYVYMGQLTLRQTEPYERKFWEKNQIKLLHARVDFLELERKTLRLASGGQLSYDTLILATGSHPRRLFPHLPPHPAVRGLYSKQDLEHLETRTPLIEQACIVGGGLIGVEVAEMLLYRQKKVTFIIREELFGRSYLPVEEALLVTNHLRACGVEILTEEAAEAPETDEAGNLVALITSGGRRIECQHIAECIGVEPNSQLARQSGLEVNRGILADEYLETSERQVFAVGDCAELQTPGQLRRAIEPLWYAARHMGQTVAATICGNATPYTPGVYFNSAKFFDIEYQTYGHVPATLPAHLQSLYWENTSANKTYRIVFEAATQTVTGVLALGIRQRQNVWEKWIKTKATLSEILPNLHEANFDPEFAKRYESEIQKTFQQLLR